MAEKANLVSVVIPTYNRRESILRLLHSFVPDLGCIGEIIIVCAGDALHFREDELPPSLPTKLKILPSIAHVCTQRNTGIKNADFPYILLCDDDIELTAGYLSTLVEILLARPALLAVSGLIKEEKSGGQWLADHPAQDTGSWIRQFIFQSPVWADARALDENRIAARMLKKYYGRRGNHLSAGGWPVLVDFSRELNYTPVFALGVSLFRTAFLRSHLYDEVLDPNGIGDNYGICMQLPPNSLAVSSRCYALHHKEPGNRLPPEEAYYRRVLALDYFQKKYGHQSLPNRMFLYWSLTGNALHFIKARKWALFDANMRLMKEILLGQNRYWHSYLQYKNRTDL